MAYDHDYYMNLDSHPSTTKRETSFDVVASEADWLKPYFNGDPKYDQVEGVTQGKIYHIHKVVPIGDVADYYFMDDNGKEQALGNFFFEKPKENPCDNCGYMEKDGCSRGGCKAKAGT